MKHLIIGEGEIGKALKQIFNCDNCFILIVNFRNRFDKALTKKVCNAWP